MERSEVVAPKLFTSGCPEESASLTAGEQSRSTAQAKEGQTGAGFKTKPQISQDETKGNYYPGPFVKHPTEFRASSVT